MMTTDDSAKKCASVCWYVSVGLGALLAIVLIAAGNWAFLWALLLGVLFFLGLGFVLPQVVCTSGAKNRPLAETSASSSLVAGDPPASDAYAPTEAAMAAAAAATPPVEDLPELEPQPAPQADPVPSEAKRPEPAKAVRKPVATPGTGTAQDTARPEALDAPRAGGKDDLKKIKGVGPKMEIALNDLGLYHYDQIAALSPAQAAWLDENVTGIRSRATRDDWRGQAAALTGDGSKGGSH